MPVILALETATPVCSVALAADGQLLALRETAVKNAHSAKVAVFIEEILSETGLSLHEIEAVAVSKGPGSYTGLRIGVSTAKGLCYGLGRPLIAVGTLPAMSANLVLHPELWKDDGKTLFCPMVDARRMEVYTALFSAELAEVMPARAMILDESSFSEFRQDHRLIFFGDGADKAAPLLASIPGALFLPGFNASASGMISLAEQKFMEGQFENVAYFEPFYLKDFIPGIPKVKGLYTEPFSGKK